MSDYMLLIVSTIFVNNILLMKYLGNCPFLGTSKKLDTALGMAMAVVFVLVLAGAITWITEQLLLKTFENPKQKQLKKKAQRSLN